MLHCDLSQQEQHRRKEIAEHRLFNRFLKELNEQTH